MKKALVLVLALVVMSFSVLLAEKPTAALSVISGAMTVDGSTADWKACGIKPLTINTKAQVAIGGPYWTGAATESAEVYVAFTAEALYLAAEVKSPKGIKNKNAEGKIYDGNCVEVFIGFDNSDPSRELYTETDYQIGFSTGEYSKANKKFTVKPSVFCFNMQKPVDGAKIVVKPATGGYVLEAMVPAEFLSGWDVREGMDLGFDIGIDDVGEKGVGRKIQMTWSGDKDGWKNPKGWGKASLKEKTCK